MFSWQSFEELLLELDKGAVKALGMDSASAGAVGLRADRELVLGFSGQVLVCTGEWHSNLAGLEEAHLSLFNDQEKVDAGDGVFRAIDEGVGLAAIPLLMDAQHVEFSS